MLKLDMLLQLLVHLQSDVAGAQGRRTLLNYARNSSGAKLCLLFVLDKERQELVLLERSGRRPHNLQNASPGSNTSMEQFETNRLSLHGLFGSALQGEGLLYIPDTYADPRSLPGERYWAWPGGRIILSPIGQQGMLVLCFNPVHTLQQAKNMQAIDEGNILICTTLLSAYLSSTDKKASAAAKRNAYDRHVAEQQAAIGQERSRIAHEIHDGPGQQIAHAIQRLEFAQRVFEKRPQVALRELDRACNMLRASLHDLRRSISALIPAQLEEQEFNTAMKTLLEEYSISDPNVKIRYNIDNLSSLPRSLEAPLFRFIQEALNNVRKHAQASQVSIRIRMLSGLLVVEVNDNGIGFDPSIRGAIYRAPDRVPIGLRIMRERIQEVGGNWEIRSKRGEGTSVIARVPLATPPAVLTSREREVLRLVTEGLTNRGIAERLLVSTETVKSHVHHIMHKMQVKDRTQAAVLATRQQWL